MRSPEVPMGNDRVQCPTLQSRSQSYSILQRNLQCRASNKDLVGGKHPTIRKNKGWSCSSAKPHHEGPPRADHSQGANPSNRIYYTGKRLKRRMRTSEKCREFHNISPACPTFSDIFTFSLDANPGPRHCSKTRLRNASDLSIMLSKPHLSKPWVAWVPWGILK